MPREPRKRRRRIVLAIVCGAVALTAWVPFHVVWDPLTRLRLAWDMALLRITGEPVRVEHLAKLYPEPPAGENAAELYRRAQRLLWASQDEDLHARPPRQRLGYRELLAPGAELPAKMLADIREYLKSQQEPLNLLHEAATKTGCRFDIEWSRYLSANWAMGVVPSLQDSASLLALEAAERAVSGRPDEAADAASAGLRLADALRRIPLWDAQDRATECEGTILDHLEWALALGLPSPDALLRLEEAIGQNLDRQPLEKWLLTFRCMVICEPALFYVFTGPSDSPGPAERLRRRLEPAKRRSNTYRPFLRHPRRSLTPREWLFLTKMLNACIAAARKLYPEALPAAERIACARLAETTKGRRSCMWDVLVMIDRAQVAAGRLECARTALAVLRYRATHGKLPEKLDNLVPEFLQSVPPGPFAGEALLYGREPWGFGVSCSGAPIVADLLHGRPVQYFHRSARFNVTLPSAQ